MVTPLAPCTPLEKNCRVTVAWPYSGVECAPNKQGHETGYVSMCIGEGITILSGAEKGHETNSYPFYVYCEKDDGSRGWAPQLLLHRDGFGSYGVVLGLAHNKEVNNTLVRVLGLRGDGRVVAVTKGNRQIAVRHANIRLLDVTHDIKQIQENGKRSLLYAHPDRYGCPYSLQLKLLNLRM